MQDACCMSLARPDSGWACMAATTTQSPQNLGTNFRILMGRPVSSHTNLVHHAGREKLGNWPIIRSRAKFQFPLLMEFGELYWNSLLFGEFSRKFTHILNTTEFQYWDVEHSESHRNPGRVISFSNRNFVGKLIHLIISQNSSPTLIGLRRPARIPTS